MENMSCGSHAVMSLVWGPCHGLAQIRAFVSAGLGAAALRSTVPVIYSPMVDNQLDLRF